MEVVIVVVSILSLAVGAYAAFAALKRANFDTEKLKLDRESLSVENGALRSQLLAEFSQKHHSVPINIPRSFLKKNVSSMPQDVEDQSLQHSFVRGRSSTLVIFMSGLGLDHTDFDSHLTLLEEYDCVALSAYGFEPSVSSHHNISLSDHSILISHVINRIVGEEKYEKSILLGFSVGADLLLRVCADGHLDSKVNAVVALDPNINNESLFISRELSKKYTDTADALNIIDAIHTKKPWTNIEDWDKMVEYLQKIFRKYGSSRLSYIQHFASMITDAYKSDDTQIFEHLITAAKDNVSSVYIIFSESIGDDVVQHDLANKLDVNIEVLDGTSHFDLIRIVDISKNAIEKV